MNSGNQPDHVDEHEHEYGLQAQLVVITTDLIDNDDSNSKILPRIVTKKIAS